MMQLLYLAGILALISYVVTAEKCRQLVGGGQYSSRERFSFINCFDMSYGTTACLVKEIIKFYLYYTRAIYVQKVKEEASEKALKENLSERQDFDTAVEAAREEGNAAARSALRRIRHIMGPMLTAVWDLFETIIGGGSLMEGIFRSVGAFVCAYFGGYIGEGKIMWIPWIGFVVGSQFGSWIGGRLGLIAYDLGNGVLFLRHGMCGN